MRGFLDRKSWEGPVGIARIVLGLSAIGLIVVALTGLTAAKALLPMLLIMLTLGFLGGYQLGQTRRQ